MCRCRLDRNRGGSLGDIAVGEKARQPAAERHLSPFAVVSLPRRPVRCGVAMKLRHPGLRCSVVRAGVHLVLLLPPGMVGTFALTPSESPARPASGDGSNLRPWPDPL